MKVFEIGVTFIKCPFLFCEVVIYVYGVKCDCVTGDVFFRKGRDVN
jgi:hypothetical protein